MSKYRDKRTGHIGEDRYELLRKMIADGKTAIDISNAFDVNSETIRKFARKRGLKITPVDMKMENHPMWKDGTTFDSSGYKLVRVKKNSEFGYLIRAITKRGKAGTDSSGYAPEHRIVMHKKLGRKLIKGEVVDHIDGDKTNNMPENLRVFSSNAEHLKQTLKGKIPNWTPEGKSRMTGRPPNPR